MGLKIIEMSDFKSDEAIFLTYYLHPGGNCLSYQSN